MLYDFFFTTINLMILRKISIKNIYFHNDTSLTILVIKAFFFIQFLFEWNLDLWKLEVIFNFWEYSIFNKTFGFNFLMFFFKAYGHKIKVFFYKSYIRAGMSNTWPAYHNWPVINLSVACHVFDFFPIFISVCFMHFAQIHFH